MDLYCENISDKHSECKKKGRPTAVATSTNIAGGISTLFRSPLSNELQIFLTDFHPIDFTVLKYTVWSTVMNMVLLYGSVLLTTVASGFWKIDMIWTVILNQTVQKYHPHNIWRVNVVHLINQIGTMLLTVWTRGQVISHLWELLSFSLDSVSLRTEAILKLRDKHE